MLGSLLKFLLPQKILYSTLSNNATQKVGDEICHKQKAVNRGRIDQFSTKKLDEQLVICYLFTCFKLRSTF